MTELPPSPPKYVTSVANAVVSAILRSPLHGVLSNQCIILSFTGRKSGTTYTFPLGYYDLHEDSLALIPLHRWWVNLRGNVPVTVWLKGKQYKAIANATQGDEETITELLRLILASSNLTRMYKIQPNESEHTRQVASLLPLVRIRLISAAT